MNKSTTNCLVLILGLALGLKATAAYPTVDLSAKPEVLALLRANYVDYSKFKGDDLGQMIAQSGGGVSVAPATASSSHMFGTMLPGNVIYWRAGSFTPKTTWNDLTAQINKSSASAAGLILDLRSNTTPDDFGGALRIAGFLSNGQTGLTFRQASFQVPAASDTGSLQGRPMLIVLTNRQTQGAAEILAAALQSQGALVMGEETKGRAAIFQEVPLNSGNVLRYATAHVYLSNGVDLWDRPVVPDVTTTTNAQEEAGALALIDRQQVADVITETAQRHRMSEAALVRGQDPEQDAFITSHEQAAPAPQAPVTRDLALVEALDSFKAIRVLQGQASSPQPRVADTLSSSGSTVIASSGMGR
jgi:hypothetical protein